MARSTFPIVPILLLGSGALAIWAFTRRPEVEKRAATPPSPPRLPTGGIVVPGQTIPAPGQAVTRFRNPYIFQTPPRSEPNPPDLNFPTPGVNPNQPPFSNPALNPVPPEGGGGFQQGPLGGFGVPISGIGYLPYMKG